MSKRGVAGWSLAKSIGGLSPEVSTMSTGQVFSYGSCVDIFLKKVSTLCNTVYKVSTDCLQSVYALFKAKNKSMKIKCLQSVYALFSYEIEAVDTFQLHTIAPNVFEEGR